MKQFNEIINNISNIVYDGGNWEEIHEYLDSIGWEKVTTTYTVISANDTTEVSHIKDGIEIMVYNDVEVVFMKGNTKLFNLDFSYTHDDGSRKLYIEF